MQPTGGGDGLLVPLQLYSETEGGLRAGKQQRRERIGGLHERREQEAQELLGVDAVRDQQVVLVGVAERPPAGQGHPRPVRLPPALAHPVIVRAEQVADLVVVIGHYRLLEGDEVRLEPPERLAQHPSPRRPVPVPGPDVHGQYPQAWLLFGDEITFGQDTDPRVTAAVPDRVM